MRDRTGDGTGDGTRDRTAAASTNAALAVLLVAGVMTGASVAATGDGLGVRTEATVQAKGHEHIPVSVRRLGDAPYSVTVLRAYLLGRT